MRKKEAIKNSLTWIFALVIQVLTMTALGVELPELTTPSTISGQPTSASFFGGATADNGTSFLASYAPDDLLDILGEIHVESGHVNSIGNIYIIAVALDQFFIKASDGGFIPGMVTWQLYSQIFLLNLWRPKKR